MDGAMQWDALHIQPPPPWALEGGLLYVVMAVVASAFFGKAAAKFLLLALAVGVGPLSVLMMPRVMLAAGLVLLYLMVRRYGWRWLIASATFYGILAVNVTFNLERLGAGMAFPPLVFAALVEAVISTAIMWGLLFIGWGLFLLFTGRLFLLLRSGWAGERQQRAQHAEVKLAKAGRAKLWQKGLTWATRGRYQPPKPPTKGQRPRPSANGPRPNTTPVTRPAAVRRARARRARARRATP